MRHILATSLVLAPLSASADVAPQDVWDNIKAAYSAMGLSVSGTPTPSGNGLVVADGTLSVIYPLVGGQATMTLPEMTFADQGDGTVAVITPDTYAIDLTADVPDADGQLTASVTISQSGLSSIASGVPGDVTYTSSTDSFDMLINNVSFPGEDVSFTLQLDSDGYTYETRIQDAGVVTISTAGTNSASVTSYTVESEAYSENSTSSGGEITLSGTLVLPPDMNLMNLTPALAAGLSLELDTQTGPSTGSSTITTFGQTSEQMQQLGASTATMSFSADGLTLNGTGESLAMSVNDPSMIPFPISFNTGAVTFDFAVPMVARDTPQSAVYSFGLADLTVADDLWNMIDAGNQLDRTPADIVFDLAGTLDWGLDTLDVMQWIAIEDGAEVPIKPLSAEIRALNFGALGAAITGMGAFTFDNDDMVTIPGVPRPEGSATLTASGINAAMDQLVAAGLIAETDISSARLMMGLFARTTGDDQLETTVEINAEGHVIVNGQRMR